MLLQAMLLVNEKIEVSVVARSPPGNVKSQLVESIGGAYFSTSRNTFEEIVTRLGAVDLVVDASGSSSLAFQALPAVGNNGVLCLTSITGGNKEIIFPSDKANLDMVLGNKTIFGSVNAHPADYYKGLRSLEKFMNDWPNTLSAFFTRRVPLHSFAEAFEFRSDDIKTTIEISDG